MDLTFDLTDKDGNEASQSMSKIIQARVRELGQTTIDVCKAIAINVLKGIRSDTKVANEKDMDISIVNVDDIYTPSFRVESGKKGKNVRDRVLRGGIHGVVKVIQTLHKKGSKSKIDDHYVVWRCPKYSPNESIHTYEVEDKISPEKTLKYLVVTTSEGEARKFAETSHRNRVHRHKGFAKYVLGMAMHHISANEKPNVNLSQDQQIADQAQEVSVTESGYDSGVANIHAHDKLDYATLAMKNGEAFINTIIQKTLNKMTGFVNHQLHKKGIYDDLKIPYPELTKRSE